MKFKDILEGNGENYILLSKESDRYKIVYTGERMLDIYRQLEDMFNKVKKEYDTNRIKKTKTTIS